MKPFKYKVSVFIIINLLISYTTLLSQTTTPNISKLQLERQKLINQIYHIRKELKATEQKKQKKFQQIDALNKQIELNDLIIKNIDDEIVEVQREIEQKNVSMAALFVNLDNLKKEYSKVIYLAYKTTHGLNQFTYILSSESFNQFAQRLSNIKHYSKFRVQNFYQIKHLYKTLNTQKEDLEAHKSHKKDLIKMKTLEIDNLTALKRDHADLVKKLTQDEESLKNDLKTYNKNVAKLDGIIKRVIQESIKENERREAEKRAEDQKKLKNEKVLQQNQKQSTKKNQQKLDLVKKDVPSSKSQEITTKTDYKLISEDFAQQKGKLPWPVDKGVVVGKMGIWPHQIAKGVLIENLGINIQVKSTSEVKVIFKGLVRSVIFVPGMQNVIIIQHGKYHTIYAKLTKVCVKPNQTVQTGQKIGSIEVEDNGKPEMQLQIWHGTTKVNPQHWLKKMHET